MRLNTVSWSSIIVGSIASVAAYLILNIFWLSLGMDLPLAEVIRGPVHPAGASFNVGSALLLALTVALSLLIGTFAAGRTLPLISSGHRAGHGLMVAAIFFLVLPSPAVTSIPGQLGMSNPGGDDTEGLSGLVNKVSTSTERLGGSPAVYRAVTQALAGASYPRPLPAIAGSVLMLLRQSDPGGVRNFLASQGLSGDEAGRRAQAAQAAYQESLQVVQARARGHARAAGWTFLVVLFLGGGFAVLGAALGARVTEIVDEIEREELSRAA